MNACWSVVAIRMAGAIPAVLLLMMVLLGLVGCTTVVSHMSIDPYLKSKPLRDAVEEAAETYCRKKRRAIVSTASATLPDYLFTTDGCTRWPDDDWSKGYDNVGTFPSVVELIEELGLHDIVERQLKNAE